MSRSVGLAHIVRQPDGTSKGVWGVFALRSAFQPIFTFQPGGKLIVTAFEGLIRPERDGAALAPGVFFAGIPAADRMHVETLTRTLHLLNAGACLDASSSIFVNFDPSLFSERALTNIVLRDMRLVLHEAGIDACRIVCEVTEQRASSDRALFLFVEALRENGFRIAIDDYGAQDSGIQRINDLKPDIVKFDAHWIARLMTSRPGHALLQTMVAEFRAKGILNLFEGIEEPWQLELAEECGVDMVQGYVLARPETVPANFSSFFGGGSSSTPANGSSRAGGETPVLEERPARHRSREGRQSFGRRA